MATDRQHASAADCAAMLGERTGQQRTGQQRTGQQRTGKQRTGLSRTGPLRFGGVNYLNSKPLLSEFDQLAAGRGRLCCDLPSRLADSLQQGELDVALIPVFEFLSSSDLRRVSDACVASDGPVASVKLYFRVPPDQVRRLALDEGSRTSAALSRVLLAKRFGLRPELTKLPIGAGTERADGDAVLLIGDRAMHPPAEAFCEAWDLGEQWRAQTGLPFVFACWAARAEVDTTAVAPLLTACRDAGLGSLAEIAAREAPALGVQPAAAERYLRENLRFTLGERERAGLEAFETHCREVGLLGGS